MTRSLTSLALALIGCAVCLNAEASGPLDLTVNAADPKWDTGAPVSSNLLPDLWVRLYGARQGATKELLDAKPWAPAVNFRRPAVSSGVHCYAASLALDTTGDDIPDRESPQTAEWCGNPDDLPPELNLAPPSGISGKVPSP